MKSPKLLISIVLIGFLFNSCNKEDLDCCTPLPLNATIFINISNDKGIDLLDQNKNESFKIENIRSFHLHNNQERYVPNSNESTKLIKFQTDTFTSYSISLSTNLINNKSRSIVKWDSKNVDTIDAIFFSENVPNRLSKVIINGKEMLDTENKTQHSFVYQIYLKK